jgi:hypothetical protein
MDQVTVPRATVQQVLGALEGGADSWRLIGPAIDALRAALEQPEQQEPVATVSQGQPGHLGWAPLPKRPDWMKT